MDTRWVLTWKDLEGKPTVKARLVARGFQDPDLADGLVDTSSCVSFRSFYLQVISLSALKKWKLWSLDIKNAFLQADPFSREVYLRAPREWCPRAHSQIWRLNAPAYGLNDAPVEFHKTLKRYLVKSTESLKLVGLRFETSKLDPCFYTVFTGCDEAVGTFSPILMTSWVAALLECSTALVNTWNTALGLLRRRNAGICMWGWN